MGDRVEVRGERGAVTRIDADGWIGVWFDKLKTRGFGTVIRYSPEVLRPLTIVDRLSELA